MHGPRLPAWTQQLMEDGGQIAALGADAGCGLLDRLIADDSRRAELTTLTLDRKMGALPQVRRL